MTAAQLAFGLERSDAVAPLNGSGAISTIRYLGSKARIVHSILAAIGDPDRDTTRFVDVFAGTGVVSRQAALRGWRVLANDHLHSAAILTTAHLLSDEDVEFGRWGGYDGALAELNATPPREGFVLREYAPSGLSASGHIRMYFNAENARRIDGMRQVITEWNDAGFLTERERHLLIADLLVAANAVANTAGTYGCYLSKWASNAVRPVKLEARSLLRTSVDFQVSSGDAWELTTGPEEVVYLDPPYTKRQYAAYYHLMETIALYDAPTVGGVTGLREWESKASPFCYKRRALAAFESLIDQQQARRVFVSYSSEGHVELEDLTAALQRRGSVIQHSLGQIGRYRSNAVAAVNGAAVGEVLVELRRESQNTSRPLAEQLVAR